MCAQALIIDQFEEIFTTHVDHWDKRKDFFSIYSPPTPKPYKFAGIRGFGDKIK
jgi:hypothetical protein